MLRKYGQRLVVAGTFSCVGCLMITGLLTKLGILPDTAATETWYITGAQRVNVRTCSSTDCAIITSVEYGEALTVLATASDWHEIRLPDGRTGYIAAWLTSSAQPPAASPTLPAAQPAQPAAPRATAPPVQQDPAPRAAPPQLQPTAAPAPVHPEGASAICNDGTYSFSDHRRGTCSHHGGVREWLRQLPS